LPIPLFFIYSTEFNLGGDQGLSVPGNIPIDIFVFSFRFMYQLCNEIDKSLEYDKLAGLIPYPLYLVFVAIFRVSKETSLTQM
jgi:hypothetical protein